MSEEVFKKRLDRAQAKIKILEALLEEKSRDLFDEKERIRAARDELEKRVTQQTEELKNANKKLEKEITVRSKIKDALFHEKERLTITLRSIEQGVIVTTEDDMILMMNPKACQYLGVLGDAPLGESLLLHIQDSDFLGEWLESKEARREFKKQELEMQGVDYLRVLSVTRSEIQNESEGIFGYVTTFQDITREREIDRMKTDFISSVSHELRTPLTSIRGFAATILNEPEMQADIRTEFMQIINDESERLSSLIEEILEISRIESGDIQLRKEPVMVRDLMSKVENMLKIQSEKKEIDFKTRNSAENTLINVDIDKIQAALINLVGNAIKFTPEHGQVVLEAKSEEPDSLSFIVSDTGFGIPEKDMPHIFERFYRVYREGKEIPGTGLGLPIVKSIVDKHFGEIEVDSREGEGTTFTMRLPLNGIK